MKKHNKEESLDRRRFFQLAGAAGAGSLLALAGCKKEEDTGAGSAGTKEVGYEELMDAKAKVPRRKLGKTGEMVPVLSHGLMYNVIDNQITLRLGLNLGLSHWDTSHIYSNGQSEIGIGNFLKKNPEAREKVFLVSKASRAKSVADVEKRLQTSLKRMNTGYIDLYYGIHAMSSPDQLTPELQRWAADAKKRGLIRHFGFSTHSNMEDCLMAASKVDWIDAVMTSYNVHLMKGKKMQDAVEACHNKNIGLIAMKVMGHSVDAYEDRKHVGKLLQKGYTEGQAKIRAVLDDKRFAAACITMKSVAIMSTNIAAVTGRNELTRDDYEELHKFAERNRSRYCAGCSSICSAAMPEAPVISDVMRYLMYFNSYGDEQKARELYRKIPASMRRTLASLDYTRAEAVCPQGLPISRLMEEAVRVLG